MVPPDYSGRGQVAAVAGTRERRLFVEAVFRLVRKAGLEPASPKALAPKAGASALNLLQIQSHVESEKVKWHF
jgi:hypothetical protein